MGVEYVSGNIFIREMLFEKAGDIVDGHKHNFDHVTFVVRGSVRIEKLDEAGRPVQSIEKQASNGHNWVTIKAGVNHKITALEDHSLGHCIYAHRNPQGEVVQEFDGWQEAYR